MNVRYDSDLDYLEVFMKSAPNFEEPLKGHKGVSVFKSEKNDEIVGYAFDHASYAIDGFSEFDPIEKLAILLKITRTSKGWSQEETAEKLGISLRHYQRLESGQDTTLSQLQTIMTVFPEVNFSSIFNGSKKAS